MTPANADPHHVVALAQLSEEVGLDLVTFQDHPYQPAFLDTWTLLSYVAAQTTDDPPLGERHQPAAARRRPCSRAASPASTCSAAVGSSSASAPARSGTPSRRWAGAASTPGQARAGAGRGHRGHPAGLGRRHARWRAGRRRVLPGDGRQARTGAGPRHRDLARRLQAADARADRPQRRRLAAVAELPEAGRPRRRATRSSTMRRSRPDAHPRTSADSSTSTAAFAASGSGPLHGPPAQWVDELAELALTDGISAFILGSDDPDDLRRFAGEVAPPSASWSPPSAPSPTVPAARAHRSCSSAPVEPPALGGLRRQPTSPSPWCRPRTTARASATCGSGTSRRRPTGPAPDPTAPTPPHEQATGQHLVDVHDAPASRARRGQRPDRAGRGRHDRRRRRTLAHQHDDHAAEQVDAWHVLRVLLPHRDHPPQHRGPERASPTWPARSAR